MPRSLSQVTARYRAAQQAVDAAKAQVLAAQDELRQARSEMAEALVAQYRAGTRMRDLAIETGLSREWIRTRLRQAGILADD